MYTNFFSRYIYNFIFKTSLYLTTNNKRFGNTKTRGLVSGGGKKPYKQKGTGLARSGSIRSPIYRKGGIIFGPKYCSLLSKLNMKELLLSIILILLMKLKKILLFYFGYDTSIFNFQVSKLLSFFKTILNSQTKHKILKSYILILIDNNLILKHKITLTNVIINSIKNLDLSILLQATSIWCSFSILHCLIKKYDFTKI